MNQDSKPDTNLTGADRHEISAVLTAYATGIDRRDWALFERCFTQDCLAEYGSFGTWHGAAEITAYMRQAHADLGLTLHRITNIDIRPGEDGALSNCYVDALLLSQNEGGPTHSGIGTYEDRFARTDRGWKIAHRQFHAVLID